MQRLRPFGSVLLLAVLTLGVNMTAPALGASVEILTKEHKQSEAVKISGTSTKETKLSILGSSVEVKCPEVTTESVLEGKSLLGLFHLHWKGCTTSAGGTCTGLGDESGLVLALGKWHLVEDKLLSEGALGLGVLALVEHMHLACKVVFVEELILVLGEVLCLLGPLTLGTTLTVKCEGEKGDSKETVYWNEKGERVEIGSNGLKAAKNEGAEEMAAENGELTGTASEEIELMD